MFCVCHITSESNKSSFRKLVELELLSEVSVAIVAVLDGYHF